DVCSSDLSSSVGTGNRLIGLSAICAPVGMPVPGPYADCVGSSCAGRVCPVLCLFQSSFGSRPCSCTTTATCRAGLPVACLMLRLTYMRMMHLQLPAATVDRLALVAPGHGGHAMAGAG